MRFLAILFSGALTLCSALVLAQQPVQQHSIKPLRDTVKRNYYFVPAVSSKTDDTDTTYLIIKLKTAVATKANAQGRMQVRARITEEHESFLASVDALTQRSNRGRSELHSYKVQYDYKDAFNGFAIITTKGLAEQIKNLPVVASVTRNKKVYAFDDSGNLAIKAPDVWSQFQSKGKGIRIGVIDTGIDYNHPDLGGGFGPTFKVAGGYDFFNNDPDPIDDHGHGTHVAGIAAGSGKSSVTGVAPEATLYAYKVLGAQGYGGDAEILAAIERTVNPDGNPETDDALDVVNMSLGRQADPSEPLSEAVNNAVAQGVVFVVAAGNSYDYFTVGTPAIAEKAITVAATDFNGNTAYFSSRGPVANSFAFKPDVAAPGIDIVSSYLNGTTTPLSGTSMASPHVAGAAALILDNHPTWTPQEVKSALMNTANPWLSANSWEQGTGLINVLAAVQSELLVSPGAISMGLMDNTQTSYTKTYELTVSNTGSVDKVCSMGISGEIDQPGFLINFSKPSFTVPPNGEVKTTVSVTLNTILLPKIEFPDSYSGHLIVTTNQKSILVPLVLSNPHTTTVTMTNTPPSDIIVMGVPPNNYWKVFPANTGELKLMIPKGTYDIFAVYQDAHLVIMEDVIVAGDESFVVDKSLAKNTILHEPKDKSGNIIPREQIMYGSMVINGRNILMSYGGFMAEFRVSDQKYSKLDYKYHVNYPVGSSDYYEFSATLNNGVSESVSITNTPADFKTFSPKIPDQKNGSNLKMNYYMRMGYPWFLFTSWNTVPMEIKYPITFYKSHSGDEPRILNSIEFLQAGEAGYNWETGDMKFYDNRIHYFRNLDDPIQSVDADVPFEFGKGILSLNGFVVNYQSSNVHLSEFLNKGMFNHTFGDRQAGTITYKLTREEVTIKEGILPNTISAIPGGDLYIDTTPGPHSLSLEYNDFQVGGKFAKATAVFSFNTQHEYDLNSPAIKYFSLRQNNVETNQIEEGKEATLHVKIIDHCGYVFWCNSSGLSEVKLKIRVHGSEEWTDLSLASADGENYEATLADNLPAGYYDITIYAADNAGNKLTYAIIPGFLVGEGNPSIPYTTVSLLEPKNYALNTGTLPTFKWSEIQGATYALQISSNQNFTENITEYNSSSSQFPLITPLEGNKVYYWRVKATVNGSSTNWSPVFQFKSNTLIGTTLLTPQNNSLNQSAPLNFTWQPVPEASSYVLELSLTEDFSTPFTQLWFFSTFGEVTWLIPDVTYYWRVGTVYTTWTDSYTVYSAPFKFSTGQTITDTEGDVSTSSWRSFPNPFTDRTVFTGSSRQEGHATYNVVDAIGKVVRSGSLYMVAGENNIPWDGRDDYGHLLPAGMYSVVIRGKAASIVLKTIIDR